MRIGLFSSPGSRGRGSAEAQVAKNEPLQRHEVQEVLHRDRKFVTVGTKGGQTLLLTRAEAAELRL